MTTLTDYLNPAEYPALQSLPFAVFITGKHHAVNEALYEYLTDEDETRWEQYPRHAKRCYLPGFYWGHYTDWHYSEYDAELRALKFPFAMIVQSLELIHVAFRVFGERMTLIRVDKVGDGYELMIYNHAAMNAAVVTNWEIR